MKTLIATLLATAASASFAAAPTLALNHDPATYRNVSQKAAADYKTASAKCSGMSGNDKDVCIEEAKVARAHAEADAVAQYNNTAKGRAKSRTALADADYSLAKAKCGALSGADKDNCMNTARSVHTAAVADAKADRDTTITATGSSDATKAAAADKCAQLAGSPKTGCLIDNKKSVTATTGSTVTTGAEIANRTENAAETAVDKTRNAAANAAEKTREMASTAVETTRKAAATVARKTENAMDTAGDRTRHAAATVADKTALATDTAADKTAVAAGKTGAAVADSVITTKVKAGIFKEPELKSMAIHVETEKGVVMLSGFVDSKSDADKAVKLARSVDGVTSVKSAIKVK
jgi:hyperosmotically inducible protein